MNVDTEALHVSVPPGRVAVKMDPPRETQNGIVLPDELKAKLQPEAGIVVDANWTNIPMPEGFSPLEKGERVLLRPYAGLWADSLGPFAEPELSPTPCRAVSGRLIIRLDPEQTMIGSFFLPDISIQRKTAIGEWETRVQTGVVVSAPSNADQGIIGKRVLFSRYAAESIDSEHVAVRDGENSVGQVSHGIYAILWPGVQLTSMRFFGVSDKWNHEIIAVYRDDRWQPLPNWALIKRQDAAKTNGGIYVPRPENKDLPDRAQVIECDSIVAGTNLIVSRDCNVPYRMRFGGEETKGLEFVEIKNNMSLNRSANIYAEVSE